MNSDFCYEVILSRCRPWCLPTTAHCGICKLPASTLSACDVIASLYALQFLIHIHSNLFYCQITFIVLYSHMMSVDAVGLPVFHHVLVPRSKGLWLCIERLRACTSAVYDVTIAYSSTLKSTSNDNVTVRTAAPSLSGMLHCQLCILVTSKCLLFEISDCRAGNWCRLWNCFVCIVLLCRTRVTNSFFRKCYNECSF